MARTPQARTAGQRPFIASVAVVVLALSGTIAAQELADRADQVDSDPAALPGEDGATDGPDGGPVAVAVGPPTGAAVEAYLRDRQAALADAPADVTVAVVSFRERMLIVDAVAAAGEQLTIRQLLLRVPLEGMSPVAVDAGDDPRRAAVDALEQIDAELQAEDAAIRAQLETVTDQSFIDDYELRLVEIADARQVTSGPEPSIHGLVVEGPLAALRALQQLSTVRLVDPAPPGTDVAASQFFALLPEDDDTVSDGR